MKHGKKALIIAAICLTVLILMGYVFSPYIDAYKVNRNLDISGVKLLMSPSEVEKILGEGSPIGGFGAHFYGYDNSAVVIAYPVDGMLEDKAGQIDISDSKYSICGVRPGTLQTRQSRFLRSLVLFRIRQIEVPSKGAVPELIFIVEQSELILRIGL